MQQSLIEALAESVIVADGAMGTMLYAKGVYVNRCYDEMNLSEPDNGAGDPRAYLQAGRRAAGDQHLRRQPGQARSPTGWPSAPRRSTAAAPRWPGTPPGSGPGSAGSVGPLGKPLSPIGKISVSEAIELFRPQIRGLVAGGVGSDPARDHERSAGDGRGGPGGAQGVRPADHRHGHLPRRGAHPDGLHPRGGDDQPDPPGRCRWWGPTAPRGPTTCSTPSSGSSARPTRRCPSRRCPTPGSPRLHDDRVLYMTSPEYMAEYARRFIQAGANLVGGCCGTTPDHIRAIKAMVKALKPPGRRRPSPPRRWSGPSRGAAARLRSARRWGPSWPSKSVLGHKFVVSVEMNPPRGHDVKKVLAAAERLRFHGRRRGQHPRRPAGQRADQRPAHRGADPAVGRAWRRCCTTPAATATCWACRPTCSGPTPMGLRNVLAVTGDPPKLGNYPHVTAVYDVESIGLVRVLQGLNRGVDLAASPIGEPTKLSDRRGRQPRAPPTWSARCGASATRWRPAPTSA